MWVCYQQISNCCRPVMTYWLTDWHHQWLTDCWSCMAFCCSIFFFVTAVVHSQSWDFIYGWCEHLFLSGLDNAFLLDKYFETVFGWLGFTWQFPLFTSCSWRFFNKDISQCSVMTYLRFGGIFKYDFITNLLLSRTWKNLENGSTFGEVTDNIIVSCFFCLTVYILYNIIGYQLLVGFLSGSLPL